MALTKTLEVKIGADTSGFQRGLKRVSAGLTSIKSQALSAAKAGLALAGIAVGLQQLGESFKSYLSLESSVKRVNDLFADSAKYVQYFAQNAQKNFGLAESAAYQYAAVYGNLFKGIIGSTEENAKVTIAMLKASSVVASKTGRTMDDVMERIRSGLLGNTEAIEDLGIQVNVAMLETTDAFRRMANGRSWEQLEFYEQQQIRTLAILEQAHKAYGDEVTQGSAYSVNGLSSAFSDLQSTMGMFLNAALQPVIKGLTELVRWANAGLKAIGSYFGLDARLKSSAAASSDNMASGYEAATEAIEDAEKAQRRMVAGFDQVNIITKKDAAASSGGTTSGGGTASGVFDSLPELEFSAAEQQLPNVSGLIETFKTKIAEAGQAVREYFGADTIAEIQSYAVSLGGTLSKTGSDIVGMVTGSVSSAVKVISQIASSDAMRGITSNLLSSFVSGVSGILSYASMLGRDLLYLITSPFTNNSDALGNALEKMLSPIKTRVETIKIAISNSFAKIKEVYQAKISPMIRSFADGFSELGGKALALYSDHIAPMLDRLEKKWRETYENHIQPMINKGIELFGTVAENIQHIWETILKPFIGWCIDKIGPPLAASFELFQEKVQVVVGVISDIAGGLIDVLGGIITFTVGTWTNDWERAWTGIKDIFKGIWNSIVGIVEGAINFCVVGINGMIRQLNKVSIKVPDWVPAIGGKNFGFNVTEIAKVTLPRLADGGILSTPTAALLAEYPGAMSNPEIAAPQSVIHDTVIEANSPMVIAIVSAIQRLEKTLKEKDMDVYLGDDEIARSAARGNRDHIMRTGKALIGG